MSLLKTVMGKPLEEQSDEELEALLADVRSQRIPKVDSRRKKVGKKHKAEIDRLLDMIHTEGNKKEE